MGQKVILRMKLYGAFTKYNNARIHSGQMNKKIYR